MDPCVVVEILRTQGRYQPAAITDTDPHTWNRMLQGVPVVGDDSSLPALRSKGVAHFILGLGSVRNNRPRKGLYKRTCALGFKPITATHQSAVVSETVQVETGTVICPAAVLNADVWIGPNVIINTGAIIEHDSIVESHAHICPGASIAGGVTVEEGGFVGIGAVVKQGIRIGAWSVVGAGSVVLEDVPSGAVVVGHPARILSSPSVSALSTDKTYRSSPNAEVLR